MVGVAENSSLGPITPTSFRRSDPRFLELEIGESDSRPGRSVPLDPDPAALPASAGHLGVAFSGPSRASSPPLSSLRSGLILIETIAAPGLAVCEPHHRRISRFFRTPRYPD